MDFLTKYSQAILGVLRIVVGAQFLEHGSSKLLAFPMPASGHAIALMSFPGGASGIIELVAGALILLGLFSRVAAFIASGEMAVAYFMAHFPRGPFPILNGGDLAVTWCFLFLFLAAAGPGAFAINRK
jgi:putative oxidoreductase